MKRGFTLMELLVLVVILGVFGLFATHLILNVSGSNTVRGDETAAAFARNLTPPGGTANVECAGRDTDGNGYVSCTVFVHNDGQVTPHAIECASHYSFNKGCRLARGVFTHHGAQ